MKIKFGIKQIVILALIVLGVYFLYDAKKKNKWPFAPKDDKNTNSGDPNAKTSSGGTGSGTSAGTTTQSGGSTITALILKKGDKGDAVKEYQTALLNTRTQLGDASKIEIISDYLARLTPGADNPLTGIAVRESAKITIKSKLTSLGLGLNSVKGTDLTTIDGDWGTKTSNLSSKMGFGDSVNYTKKTSGGNKFFTLLPGIVISTTGIEYQDPQFKI